MELHALPVVRHVAPAAEMKNTAHPAWRGSILTAPRVVLVHLSVATAWRIAEPGREKTTFCIKIALASFQHGLESPQRAHYGNARTLFGNFNTTMIIRGVSLANTAGR